MKGLKVIVTRKNEAREKRIKELEEQYKLDSVGVLEEDEFKKNFEEFLTTGAAIWAVNELGEYRPATPEEFARITRTPGFKVKKISFNELATKFKDGLRNSTMVWPDLEGRAGREKEGRWSVGLDVGSEDPGAGSSGSGAVSSEPCI